MHLSVADADAMRQLGVKLAKVVRAGDVLVLDGPLGAGKTTFTQGLAQGLGVSGAVTSPTFVVARVHKSVVNGPALVHVDAYRLTGPDDIEDLDFDQYGPHVLVMEWGSSFVSFITDDWLMVKINRDDSQDTADDPAGGIREVCIEPHGVRWKVVDFQQVIS